MGCRYKGKGVFVIKDVDIIVPPILMIGDGTSENIVENALLSWVPFSKDELTIALFHEQIKLFHGDMLIRSIDNYDGNSFKLIHYFEGFAETVWKDDKLKEIMDNFKKSSKGEEYYAWHVRPRKRVFL